MTQLVDLLDQLLFPFVKGKKAIATVRGAWQRSENSRWVDFYAAACHAALQELVSHHPSLVIESADLDSLRWVLGFNAQQLAPRYQLATETQLSQRGLLVAAFRSLDLLSSSEENLPDAVYGEFVSALVAHAERDLSALALGESPRFRQALLAEMNPRGSQAEYEGNSEELASAAKPLLRSRRRVDTNLGLAILLLSIAARVATTERDLLLVADVALSRLHPHARLLDVARGALVEVLAQEPKPTLVRRLRLALFLIAVGGVRPEGGIWLLRGSVARRPIHQSDMLEAQLPSIEDQPGLLIDFALGLDPNRFSIVTRRLVDRYSRGSALELREPASDIRLASAQDQHTDSKSYYDESLVDVFRTDFLLELLPYAKLMIAEGHNLDVGIQIADIMLETGSERYEDVSWFLERIDTEDREQRTRVLRAYMQLAQRFETLGDQSLERAIWQGVAMLLRDVPESGVLQLARLYPYALDRLAEFLTPSKAAAKEYRAYGPPIYVERHTEIDFPEGCARYEPAELRVRLTRDMPAKTRAAHKVSIDAAFDLEQIVLHVNVSAQAFAIQQPHRPLTLPVKGDSDIISFTLIPLELGEQCIEVEFIYGATRVGYALVTTEVQQMPVRRRTSNATVMQDPTEGLRALAEKPPNLNLYMLNVSWQRHAGKLSYTTFSVAPKEIDAGEQDYRADQSDETAYLENFSEFLTEAADKRNPSRDDWDSILLNLSSLGDDLRKKIVPDNVSAKIAAWPDGSTLIISSNEGWVPWELLHDHRGFWGDRFILARLPRHPDGTSVTRPPEALAEYPRVVSKIVNVIGGGLQKSYIRQIDALFDSCKPSVSVVKLKALPVADLDKALPGAGIVHMTCHRDDAAHYLQIGAKRGKITNLILEAIARLSLDPGAMVFANACSSAAPVLSLGEFRTFGWEFYQKKASVFVGTLGAVPVGYANSFAQAVYRELLRSDAPQTIGRAVAAARQEATQQQNVFRLFYCIYGDPDFTIVQA